MPPKATQETSGMLQSRVLVFVALLLFRILNAILVQTFFQPDEYFQALEPAWEMSFGPRSGAWLTWEWRERLRTSVHPFLLSAVYRLVEWASDLIEADNHHLRAAALVMSPKLLQSCCAATMDFLTWRLATRVYASRATVANMALILTVLSPWQWFCSTRTFSNSLEATLTVASLSLFPWAHFLNTGHNGISKKHISDMVATPTQGLYPALAAAATAFYLRPTNIFIWITISACLVWCNRSISKALSLVASAALAGSAILTVFASADRAYYNQWTLPPLRFLYFNLVQSLAVFYGRNRVDYYFTEGLPLLLTTSLPFAVMGLWRGLGPARIANPSQSNLEQRTRRVMSLAVIGSILAFSAIAHKEVRFIYPLLPILHVLAADPVSSFFRRRTTWRAVLLFLGVIVNLYIAYYVTRVHQRGVVDVMHYLRYKQGERLDENISEGIGKQQANLTVGFLMPCHSTPWRSHLVYPEIDAWALTCEPPIHVPLEDRQTYLDEADIFYQDPIAWINKNMAATDDGSQEGKERHLAQRAWPEYLVFFEHLQPTVGALLERNDYHECKRFFNTHWHDDGRRKGDVLVWCARDE